MHYIFGSYYDLDSPPRSWEQTYTRGRTMRNPGDLVYAAGLMDILRTDDKVEFTPTGYVAFRGRLPLSLETINESCTAVILPFADHFRDERASLLDCYASFIRKVKIPVVVPCVGARTEAVSERTDAAAKRFVSAVLDKSASIGLRGETTARYLEKLGFVRDRHFTVVGCPSLYSAGPNLSVPAWPEHPETCAFGMNPRAGETINRFLFESAASVPFRRLISQNDFEFINYFVSKNVKRDVTHKIPWYRVMVESAIRARDYRFFYNLNSWKRCLRSVDCSISCRIHGTILALLCGVPAAIVPFETRTRELAEYHAIPTIDPDEIRPGNTIGMFADRFDFAATRKRHRENFARFLDFLHRNGLKTAFDDGGNVRPAPHADVFAEDVPCENMKPLWDVSPAVRIWRQIEWRTFILRARLRRRFPSGIPVA